MPPFAIMGVIDGGWGYVWAAYAVTWLALGGYAISLWIRHPRDEEGR